MQQHAVEEVVRLTESLDYERKARSKDLLQIRAATKGMVSAWDDRHDSDPCDILKRSGQADGEAGL